MDQEFRIEEIKISKEIDDILSICDYFNPFIKYDFQKTLKDFGYRSNTYLVFKNNQIQAIVHIPQESKDFLHDFIVYSGINYIKPHQNQTYVQIQSLRHRIDKFVANFLASNLNVFSFNSLPEVLDIRPWLWHDYPDYKIKYHVLPKFTAFINLEGQLDEINLENNLLSMMASSRRQELRKSIKLNEKTTVKVASNLK